MRLSTRGRFAITAMIDLALRGRSGPVPLADIAVRHHISLSYLEQVFSKLRQNGLVDSTRGPGGGYTLGHRGDSISVADIIRAIETDTDMPSAAAIMDRAQATKDMTQDLWDALHTTIEDYLQTITLRSLAMEQRAKGFQLEEGKPTKKGVFAKLPTQLPRTTAPNSVFALGQLRPLKG